MFEIIGNEKNLELSRQLHKDGASAGSYLFSGMDSLGKKTTALWFASLVNCSNPPGPCGECISCKKIKKEIHPDVKLITREEGKTVITIDQIRDQLVEEANYKPFEGNYRVFIVDDAHLMNEQAQNALLKTLEEPGERIIIVLVTSRPSDLLPTVVSRCRQLKFIPLPLEKVKQILIKSGAETGREISMLVNYSWGAPGKAVELAQNKTFWDLRDKLLENLNALPDGNLEDILEFVKKFHVSRSQVFELESVFEILLSWCRDIQFLQEGMKGEELINSDRFNELNQIIYCFSAEDIVNIQELIYELRNLVFNNNMNLNLALQRLFIKIKNYGSVKI